MKSENVVLLVVAMVALVAIAASSSSSLFKVNSVGHAYGAPTQDDVEDELNNWLTEQGCAEGDTQCAIDAIMDAADDNGDNELDEDEINDFVNDELGFDGSTFFVDHSRRITENTLDTFDEDNSDSLDRDELQTLIEKFNEEDKLKIQRQGVRILN